MTSCPTREQVRQWHLNYGFALVADTEDIDVYTKPVEVTGSFLVVALDDDGTNITFHTTVPRHRVVVTVAGLLRPRSAA